MSVLVLCIALQYPLQMCKKVDIAQKKKKEKKKNQPNALAFKNSIALANTGLIFILLLLATGQYIHYVL